MREIFGRNKKVEKTMKFFEFNKDGECTQVEKKAFIEAYSKSYYIGNERLVPRTIQNSKVAEEKIEKLLEKEEGIKSNCDVMNILAWKLGKIKHRETDDRETNERKEIICHKGWENRKSCKVKRYGKDWDLTKFVEYIVENKSNLEAKAEDSPQEVLDKLKIVAPNGIGTVYLITLLYFISKGKWPIYDRFAMMALNAIKSGAEPGATVDCLELPAKNSDEFSNVMEILKEKYIKPLQEIFGDEYTKKRDIDRALWVYGHCFKPKQ